MLKKYLYLISCFVFALTVKSQVDISIQTLELADTTDAQIYIYGSFNNWTPKDTAFALSQDPIDPKIHSFQK